MGVRKTQRRGIQSRLIRVFATQATVVSLATGLGVYAAYKIAENVLVRQALSGEASHFWAMREQHQDFPLPNTNNMQGYIADIDALHQLPVPLRNLGPGFGPVSFGLKNPLVYVSEHDGQRLFLVFKEEQVSKLALFFGVVPLTAVLIVIYVASWLTFRQSQRVISPVVKLAKVVEKADVRNSNNLALELAPFHAIDADIDALTTALEHFAARLEAFVERERSFTRDASHELRTPLAVIRGSVDVLSQQEKFSKSGMAVLQRIRLTTHDMEALIETLLLLAREEKFPGGPQRMEQAISIDRIVINDLLPELISQVQKALDNERADVLLQANKLLEISAPQKVVSILFVNLLRNAIHHGGGLVEVIIDERSVVIKDRGPGMDREQMQQIFRPFFRGSNDDSGHGLGLTIVKRLCERFGWKLTVYSSPGMGTSMTVIFKSEAG